MSLAHMISLVLVLQQILSRLCRHTEKIHSAHTKCRHSKEHIIHHSSTRILT